MQRGWSTLPAGFAPGAETAGDGARRLNAVCDECGSTYTADTSAMSSLCPECAHHLYGYPACGHRFVAGRCEDCGWDGSVSPYLASLTGRGRTLR